MSTTTASALASASTGASILVVVRLRPMNERETADGTLPVVTASTADRSVTVIRGSGSRQQRSSFNFDRVFASMSTQTEVFASTLKPVINDVMNGFESTVFAYGQTGTGKTHTMEGEIGADLESEGIIPRSAREIFRRLEHEKYLESEVFCSYLEIYNEELSDLLSSTASTQTWSAAHNIDKGKVHKNDDPKLEILESKSGPYCKGLSLAKVESAQDVLSLMTKAQRQRKIGETKMNKQSSRSHCLFTITVRATCQYPDGKMQFNGKLHMVDLAGSECAKSADLGTTDKESASRERERMNINRSLLSLGRVISCLKEQSEKKNSSMRIPYRDSKLTRILQESLGGRCKTVIIATLSPSITAIEESVSTLNYAQSANGIVNKPVSTSYLSVGGGSTLSINAEGGSNTNASLEYWHEMECRLEYMKGQVEEAQGALARKHLQQQEIEERAAAAEKERDEAKIQLKLNEVVIKELKQEVNREKELRKEVEEELSLTKGELTRTKFILSAARTTEEKITEEAEKTVATLREAIKNGDEYHAKLVDHLAVEAKNRSEANAFKASSLSTLSSIEERTKNLQELVKHTFTEEEVKVTKHCESNNNSGSQVVRELEELDSGFKKFATSLRKSLGESLPNISRSITESVDTNCTSITQLLKQGEESISKWVGGENTQLEECAEALARSNGLFLATQENLILEITKVFAKSREGLLSVEGSIGRIGESARTARKEAMEGMSQQITRLEGSAEESTSKITLQKEQVERAAQLQKERQKVFMENVMKGVSTLVETLEKETMSWGEELNGEFSKLGEFSKIVEETAADIGTQVSDVKTRLEGMRQMDEELVRELDGVVEVSTACGIAVGEGVKVVETSFLESGEIQKNNNEEVDSMIKQRGLNLMSMLEPRGAALEELLMEVSLISENCRTKIAELNPILSSDLEAVGALAEVVGGKKKEVEKILEAVDRRGEVFVEERKERTRVLSDSVEEKVVESCTKVEDVGGAVKTFVVGVLKGEEEVDALNPRETYKVIENFSKTGSDEEVLKRMGLGLGLEEKEEVEVEEEEEEKMEEIIEPVVVVKEKVEEQKVEEFEIEIEIEPKGNEQPVRSPLMDRTNRKPDVATTKTKTTARGGVAKPTRPQTAGAKQKLATTSANAKPLRSRTARK